jgi:hypothetical protein
MEIETFPRSSCNRLLCGARLRRRRQRAAARPSPRHVAVLAAVAVRAEAVLPAIPVVAIPVVLPASVRRHTRHTRGPAGSGNGAAGAGRRLNPAPHSRGAVESQMAAQSSRRWRRSLEHSQACAAAVRCVRRSKGRQSRRAVRAGMDQALPSLQQRGWTGRAGVRCCSSSTSQASSCFSHCLTAASASAAAAAAAAAAARRRRHCSRCGCTPAGPPRRLTRRQRT